MIRKLIALIILASISIFAQAEKEYFPGELNIKPFAANLLEPKIGLLINLNNDRVRLNIGNSIDIYRIESGEEIVFTLGADFFTYSALRREENFHFPVEAIDYLFGINIGYKKKSNSGEYGVRLRLSHISAHLVDGRYSKTKGAWKDGLLPQVYSREFFEFMPYYKINKFRIYCGITYNYHVDPEFLGKDNYQIGFDYFYEDIFSNLLFPFAGYDLRIVHFEDYSVNHSVVAGIKFGKPNSRGLSIYYNYYSGRSLHGEYYFREENQSSVGFNFDL